MKSLIDNDVLVKGACYGLLEPLAAIVRGVERSGVLGAARFVVPKRIQRQRLRRDRRVALESFGEFLKRNDIVEPTTEEARLASRLESRAQMLALNLDVGESQLVAILVLRAVPFLLTGDKRAITSMESLLDVEAEVAPLLGRVKCLEQLVRGIVDRDGTSPTRGVICAEPDVDRSLSVCFSCVSPEISHESICAGLDSYISDLRAAARRVLAT